MAAWLLQGFATGEFAPLELTPEPSVELQIHWIFCVADAPLQATIKSALARAILEWSPRSHDYGVLAALARTAAHVRASEAVSILGIHIQSPAFRTQRTGALQETCDIVMAVLQGFAPLDELYPVLLNLYASDDFTEYVAQLFLSLCAYSPRRFYHYVPRFLQVLYNTSVGSELRLDLIVKSFVELVPDQLIDDALSTLLLASQDRFVTILVRYSALPIGSSRGVSFEVAQSEDWIDRHGSIPADTDVTAGRPSLRYDTLPEGIQRRLFDILHNEVKETGVMNVLRDTLRRLDNGDQIVDEYPFC